MKRDTKHRTSAIGLRTLGVEVRVLLCVPLLLVACATPPRIIEVSVAETASEPSDAVQLRQFRAIGASALDSFIAADGAKPNQVFYIRWIPATVQTIRLEYRRAATPQLVESVTTNLAGHSTVSIAVSRPATNDPGPVIAWRVSLWDGTTLLAEKKSTLW